MGNTWNTWKCSSVSEYPWNLSINCPLGQGSRWIFALGDLCRLRDCALQLVPCGVGTPWNLTSSYHLLPQNDRAMHLQPHCWWSHREWRMGEFSLIVSQVLAPSTLGQFCFLFRFDSAVLQGSALHFDISFCNLSSSSSLLTRFWNFRYGINRPLDLYWKGRSTFPCTLHGVMFISLVSFRIFLSKLVNILAVLYRCLLSCLRFPVVLEPIF